MAKKSLLAMAVVLLIILMTLSAWAVPTMMNYQGRLTDTDGNPLTGTYEMTFFLLDAPSSGTIVWSENHSVVTVTDGIYNVQLGSVSNPFTPNLFTLNDELYLEVQIGSETLAPPQPVTSTAFSMKAAVAETVVDGGITTVMIEDGAVDSQKLDNNAVTGTKIADGTVSYLDIQDGSTLEEIKDDDGAGSGLDADTLDGLDSSAFSSTSHNHDSRNFTEGESDSLFVNTTGDAMSASSSGYVLRVTNSGTGNGIEAYCSSGAYSFAGLFAGDVRVTGTLIKGGGSFKIDHPLDPENKYLQHSFVESPDMMNIYNGNVVLDANGERWVELPEWFEALNKDFRYQLTCIGGFAQVYIAEEVSENRFKIAGGTASMKVSWQVTGIRQDPWAEANRIPIEEDKAADELGFYLSPESYGQPEEKGIEWVRNPEMMQKMKEEREVSTIQGTISRIRRLLCSGEDLAVSCLFS